MAKPILVANWKNYPGSLPEARALLKEMLKKRLIYKKLSLFIAPPLPYLESVVKSAKSFAHLAVQDIFVEEKGKWTGEVTNDILKSFGVRLAIIGHSERRAQGETSAEVAKKAKVLLRSGIIPLICFGEKMRDSEGEHFEYLREQLKASLAGLSAKEVGKVALAYEPVWSIGKSAKDAIVPEDLSEMVIWTRKVLTDLYGRTVASKIPMLYGGSVEPSNAEALGKVTGVRGFLVGHASLKAKSLEAIARSMTIK